MRFKMAIRSSTAFRRYRTMSRDGQARPRERRITNRYRRTNPVMDDAKCAAHVLLVLRTKAVGGLCHLATTSDTLTTSSSRICR